MGRIRGELVGFEQPPRVSVSDEEGPWRHAEVDGRRFTVAPLHPGRYRVAAITREVEVVVETEVAAGGVAEVTLRRPGRARVRGRVLELGTRQPAVGLRCGARPRLARQIGDATILTDEAGRFELVDVPAGELLVWCRARERSHVAPATLTVADGEIGEVELVAIPTPSEPRGWIGVRLDGSDGGGVRVRAVIPDAPAALAGIMAGDQVIAIGAVDTTDFGTGAVVNLVGRHPPGTPFDLTIRRDGATQTVRVTPRERPRD
jgi:hypothetical protein